MRIVWRDCGEALARLVGSVERRFVAIAPYVTDVALARVLGGLRNGTDLLVITRWDPLDVALGVSDTRVLPRVTSRGGRLLLHPRLHAKLFLADDRCALVGSANVTEKALGFANESNAELLVHIEPIPASLHVFLRWLEKSAVEATDELRRAVEMRAAEFDSIRTGPRGSSCTVQLTINREWYPSFRFPERLFAIYHSLSCALNEEQRAALDDLSEIGVPDEMDESSFLEHVRKFLLSLPHILELDAFLLQRRRFGELTAWIKNRDPGIPHTDAQRTLQTLIRWLTYFLPERYILEQPNYTEIVGRRQ